MNLFVSLSEKPAVKTDGCNDLRKRFLLKQRRRFFTVAAYACFLTAYPFPGPTARAEETPEYHTPLAGEACDIECLGRKATLLQRNRENTRAFVLGGSLFAPELAGHSFIPIGALYYKHRFDDIRVRGTFSLLVNELDASKTLGKFQILGHLDNNTIPFASSEIEEGSEVKATALKWGTVNGRLGVGYRLPVSPYQTDNDLRVQLFYQAGYLYSRRTADTGAGMLLPPDTMVQGALFRIRYDALQRNLMELPHQGIATGLDAEYLHRDNWSDANYGAGLFTKAQTQDYLKLSGYLNIATGIPLLSERNRLLTSFYGGFAPYGTLDRFSTFRVGGGPIPSEADDLERQVFPGAVFSQFPVSGYLIGALEYRREIFSFLYLHLRGTYARVRRERFEGDEGNYLGESGQVLSTGLTSGFLWRSLLHLEYSYDSKILRSGSRGSNMILLWSKSF